MRYLVEDDFYWNYRDVSRFAHKNARQARKVVSKNKDGIISLLKQGVGEEKIEKLGDTDQHLLTALYILLYLEKDKTKLDGKTHIEFIENLFNKKIDEIVPNIEIFKESIKNVIIDKKRNAAWKGEEEKKPSFDGIKIIGKKDKEAQKKADNEENSKSKEETPKEVDKESTSKTNNRQKDSSYNDDNDDDSDNYDDEKEKPLDARVKELKSREKEEFKSIFDEAIEKLKSKKESAFLELDKLMEKSRNPSPLQNAKANIEQNFSKRITKIQKAKSGMASNPKLRLQQEIAIGNSFIDRAVLLAKKTQMPNIIQRGGLAIRDIKSAIGREVKSGADAVKKTALGRAVSQSTDDKKARRVINALGQQKGEKYIYSKDESEKEALFKETLAKERKDRIDRKKEEEIEKKETAQSQGTPKTKEEEEAEREAREKKFTKTKAQQEREARDRAADKTSSRIVSSTDVSHMRNLNEDIKNKIKRNIK